MTWLLAFLSGGAGPWTAGAAVAVAVAVAVILIVVAVYRAGGRGARADNLKETNDALRHDMQAIGRADRARLDARRDDPDGLRDDGFRRD